MPHSVCEAALLLVAIALFSLVGCAQQKPVMSDLRDAMLVDSGQPKVCDRDSGVAMISSADYDRSCKADADCVAVPEGNVCLECLQFCKGGVVNKSIESDYKDAIAQLTDPLDPTLICFCPLEFIPCCIDGMCHADQACASR